MHEHQHWRTIRIREGDNRKYTQGFPLGGNEHLDYTALQQLVRP